MDATFELEVPKTIDDALGFLTRQGSMPIAGGTNVIVDVRAKRLHRDQLVSLARIAGLRGVHLVNGSVEIGGCTTVTDLLHSKLIASSAPTLLESAQVFAGQMVRNTATVGGNIACGSPAADLVPPLLSLDAKLNLLSQAGTRTIALDQFFLGYKKLDLQPNEIIAKISVTPVPSDGRNYFYKLARRKGDAISVVCLAVTLVVRNRRCSQARIALGAVAPTVFRARAAEIMLEGQTLTPSLIESAAAKAAECSSPIDDIRASADYRRSMVHVLTRRLVQRAWEELA
jgi:CO/xanthine dehydrogenase FAD-binding subunit